MALKLLDRSGNRVIISTFSNLLNIIYGQERSEIDS
jgi:hypothetical protein